MKSLEDFETLRRSECLHWLRQHKAMDPDRLAMAKEARATAPAPLHLLTQQLRLREKLRDKLPHWGDADVLLTQRAYEQSSSWASARFKTDLWQGRGEVWDLCGGLGADLLCTRQRAPGPSHHHCDTDPLLSAVVQHNAHALGLGEIVAHHGNGADFITDAGPDARLMMDPDRRHGHKRLAEPEAWSPDPRILANDTRETLIKLGPGIDAGPLLRSFSMPMDRYWLSVGGECTEHLVHRHLAANNALHHAIILNRDGTQNAQISGPADGDEGLPTGEPTNLCCLPDPAILRARLVGTVAHKHHLKALHPQVAILIGDGAVTDFPGTVLTIDQQGPWDHKALRRHLKDRGIDRLRVSCRHFPQDTATVLKMLKVREGGDRRLICTRRTKGDRWFMLCHT